MLETLKFNWCHSIIISIDKGNFRKWENRWGGGVERGWGGGSVYIFKKTQKVLPCKFLLWYDVFYEEPLGLNSSTTRENSWFLMHFSILNIFLKFALAQSSSIFFKPIQSFKTTRSRTSTRMYPTTKYSSQLHTFFSEVFVFAFSLSFQVYFLSFFRKLQIEGERIEENET